MLQCILNHFQSAEVLFYMLLFETEIEIQSHSKFHLAGERELWTLWLSQNSNNAEIYSENTTEIYGSLIVQMSEPEELRA